MGAFLLLSGIVASAIAAPLLDRIFTHRLGIVIKTVVPIVAASWFSLIWAGTHSPPRLDTTLIAPSPPK